MLGVEYDGLSYYGWQRQTHSANTVQEVLEQALAKVADETVLTHCAGRTDSGVHGLGQVVHFDTTAKRSDRGWVLGVNRYLPDNVAVKWRCDADEKFHARFSATSRSYTYIILNEQARSAVLASKVTHYPYPLDCELMQQAANALLGEHDFSAYRATACQSPTAFRDLQRLDVERRGSFVLVHVRANAFLYHMVRNLVGVLLEVGCGQKPVQWAGEVLLSRDRKEAGRTAAPDGLYLSGVRYPEHFNMPESTNGTGLSWLP